MSFGFGVGDIGSVVLLSRTVYRKCRDSPSQYKELAADALQLSNILGDLEDLINECKLKPRKKETLLEHGKACMSVLTDANAFLDKYRNMSSKARGVFDRLGWDQEDARDIRSRLTATVTMLVAFNSTLQTSEFIQMQRRVDLFLAEIRSGTRDSDSISLIASENATLSKTAWPHIVRELYDFGLTPRIIEENRDVIVEIIRTAFESGQLANVNTDDTSLSAAFGRLSLNPLLSEDLPPEPLDAIHDFDSGSLDQHLTDDPYGSLDRPSAMEEPASIDPTSEENNVIQVPPLRSSVLDKVIPPSIPPDVLVAIDFGSISTGVAFANSATNFKEIHAIKHWPGRKGQAHDRVPTRIEYMKDSPPFERPEWGFQDNGRRKLINLGETLMSYFDLCSDNQESREYNQSQNGAVSRLEAGFDEYLRCIYAHLRTELGQKLRNGWENTRIEFLFSFSATWKTGALGKFGDAVRRAGYGSLDKHTFILSHTTAEATAVWALKTLCGSFEQGNSILICNVGGGADELTKFRIEKVDKTEVDLQMRFTQRIRCESDRIAQHFRKTLENRLELGSAEQSVPLTDEQIMLISSSASMSVEFQSLDFQYGFTSRNEKDVYVLPLKNLPKDYQDKRRGIWNQKIRLTGAELESLFDLQAKKLCEEIDYELREAKMENDEEITHIVLSGGLKSSEHVQARLKKLYEASDTTISTYPASPRILISPESQLATCYGIIEDRRHKLDRGEEIFEKGTLSRISYGISGKGLCGPMPPDRAYRGFLLGSNDGRIIWGIKEHYSSFGAEERYPVTVWHRDLSQPFPYENADRTIRINVYVYDWRDTHARPTHITQGTVKLCTVTADFGRFTLNDFEEMKIWLHGKRERYWVVHYNFTIVTASHVKDMDFQVRFKGEVMKSSDQTLKVEYTT